MNGDSNVLQAAFWEAAWKKFMSSRRATEDSRSCDQADRWNKRAESFARRTGRDQGRQRVQQVMDLLETDGVLNRPLKILDIGCGPGSFAVPFTEAGHAVVALDPAQGMLDILLSRLKPGTSGNVTTVRGLWEEIDIQEAGWEKGFDLVFASMPPGVRDIETLQKMNACSRKWCYLSSFAGPRRYLLHEEIWPELFSRPFFNHVSDIIFPFNILYAMGFRPRLVFADAGQRREEKLEELASDIENFFITGREAEYGKDAGSRILEALRARAVDGRIAHEIKAQVGLMLWAV